MEALWAKQTEVSWQPGLIFQASHRGFHVMEFHLIYVDFHLATLQFTIFTPFFFQIDFLEWKNVLNVRAMERG